MDSAEIAARIKAAGLGIYDFDSDLLYSVEQLESLLTERMRGLDLAMPIRTRAKVAKSAVCEALGYPVPKSFKKTQPRFPAQDLDVSVQKADNFQIWNEEVAPERRYGLVRVDANDVVTSVRVITGEAVALLDTTGTLTTKFQARRKSDSAGSKLVTDRDTVAFERSLRPVDDVNAVAGLSPIAVPVSGRVLTLAAIHERAEALVGAEFVDPGIVNERGRGVVFQQAVCSALGLGTYADGGQFPDILCQALEVKLQLASTIDLGLVTPDSDDLAQELGGTLRHSDTRYLIGYAERVGTDRLRITAVVSTTGDSFFEEFVKFGGNVMNAKLQIPLPRGFFDTER